MGMGVIVWLLIPLMAMIVAMLWTAALARSERRRADERWRAQRMAERGSVLSTTGTPAPAQRVEVERPTAQERPDGQELPAAQERPDGQAQPATGPTGE